MARKKAAKRAQKNEEYSERMFEAALAYLLTLITGVIVYFWKQKDDYVRFHAAQSILFFVFWFVVSIILSIITAPLAFLPIAGWAILGLIWTMYWIIGIVSWLYLMYAALTGKKYEYPIIGEYAKKW